MASIPWAHRSLPDGSALAGGVWRFVFDKQSLTPRAQTYWYHPHFSCAVAIILPMVETLGQVRWRVRTRASGEQKSALYRGLAARPEASNLFQHIGMPVLFSSHRGALLCGISPSGPPLFSNWRTSKACGRTRQRLQKPQKYRVIPEVQSLHSHCCYISCHERAIVISHHWKPQRIIGRLG